MINHRFDRNIKIDYLFCFLRNIDMSSAIWVLYLIYKGIPLWQVGMLEAIFHITSFVSEVPTGILADLLGRKRVLIAGRICSLIASLLMILSTGFFGFAISFIFCAWGFNLNSGSEEALIYDSLKINGKEGEYIKINARLNVILEISQGISTFIGGVLSEYSYVFCYLTAAVLAFVSILPAFFFQETEYLMQNSSSHKEINPLQHLKVCFVTLRENKKIQSILFYYPITFTFYTVMFFYGQKYFSDYHLNKIQISIIMLIGSLISCLGAISCRLILNIFKGKTKYITSLCMSAAIMGLYLHNLVLAVTFFAISSFMNALLYPIQSDSLNKLIPSEQRATIISVNSMLFSFMMIILFPLVGFVAEVIGLHNTFLLMGILQLALLILLVKKKSNDQLI